MSTRDPSTNNNKRPAAGKQMGIRTPHLVALRGAESLRQLRDRIKKAIEELNRLRTENQKLADRIAELERGPVFDENNTIITFNTPPHLLRKRIDSFIDAIDAYLAKNDG